MAKLSDKKRCQPMDGFQDGCKRRDRWLESVSSHRKSMKTIVFSGLSKSVPKMDSLKDLCIDKLRQHLDKLSVIKDMDYKVIESLLGKCSAIQLQRLEALNPWLIPQDDNLWHDLCENEFHFTADNNDDNHYRNCVPNKTSSESWRQFYWRSIEYRKKKLIEITANIKDKNKSLKSSLKSTKVCEIETQKILKAEPIAKRVRTRAPLMRKCLQIRKQKFML